MIDVQLGGVCGRLRYDLCATGGVGLIGAPRSSGNILVLVLFLFGVTILTLLGVWLRDLSLIQGVVSALFTRPSDACPYPATSSIYRIQTF